MKTIVHLSDLHFGRVSPSIAKALLLDLEQQKPTLVVVSGDLTQRARRRQFVAAREYLNLIPFPLLTVPGNHDIPLFHVLKRLINPFDGYRRYITDDFTPLYADDRLAVMGINTVCPYRWKEGTLSEKQIERVHSTFAGLDASVFKVLVTHHPFVLPGKNPPKPTVAKSETIIEAIRTCGADLLLAGHLHQPYISGFPAQLASSPHPLLAIQAGTAISTRTREQPNAYNIITIRPPEVLVTTREWKGSCLRAHSKTSYLRASRGWQEKKVSPRE